VRVLAVDTNVQAVRRVTRASQVQLAGGGGTDMAAGIATAAALGGDRANLAEAGVNLPLLMAKSGHQNLRSLQKYARPGTEAVAAMTAAHDPARRHPR
jgi:glutamate synthase domain-containing protein 2